LFVRVQANRIWSQLMGRGLVDPPDDFRATNPASHPALLEALAQDFVKHKFDVRYLIRLIMNSRSYQLASEPNETNADDESNFSHALVRRLGAEQLLDCQSQVAGVPLTFAGYPAGLRAARAFHRAQVASHWRHALAGTLKDEALLTQGTLHVSHSLLVLYQPDVGIAKGIEDCILQCLLSAATVIRNEG
jgi:hypothetical protein